MNITIEALIFILFILALLMIAMVFLIVHYWFAILFGIGIFFLVRYELRNRKIIWKNGRHKYGR